MKAQALKFILQGQDAVPVRSELETGKPQELEKAKGQPLPVVYVLRADDLKALREFKDLVVDRGSKHPAKGLSKLLLGHDKIPLIDGGFKRTGQVQRSVRTLLRNAVKRGEANLFIVGVNTKIFAEFWETAGKVREGEAAAAGPRAAERPKDEPEVADISSWLLHELMQHCSVPMDLSRGYVGTSQEAMLVRVLIMLAAKSESPVLILGETGTGKDVVAREIHKRSDRKESSFIALNCGGIPGELLESELFGHCKGAFTNAFQDKAGLWEVAGGGTLFLDEVGDLQLKHQVKILRALQEGKIRRVGSTKDIPVKARIITATNRDLFSMVQAGEFREDLYHRLRGFVIRTPAMRENSQDIPVLAESLWRKITKDSSRTLPPEILEEVKGHRWAGNVRELKMVLQNLHGLFGAENLRLNHLKAVLYLAGQGLAGPEGEVSEKTIIFHRAGCLRHLKRVQEVVHATQYKVQPLLEGRKAQAEAGAAILASLRFGFHELETLCRQPSMFHSDAAFSAVWRLLGRLTRFQEQVQKDFEEAREYWKKEELSEEFRVVQSTLFKEVERIVDKV
jgi:hypothetical protein